MVRSRSFIKVNKHHILFFKIPILGAIITGVLTIFSYRSLSEGININETLVTENMKDRIGVEFEWRYQQQHTASVMGFLDANVTLEEYQELSKPSLDSASGSTSLGWFPRVYPKDRVDFVERANRLYESTGLDYNITYSPDFGVVENRPFNDQHMFPLLFSNPTSLTYLGYDFYIPTSINRSDSLIDLAMEVQQPVSTDKILLSLFGGPSNFVDTDLNPVSEVEAPVSFLIFHSVHNNAGESFGVIGNAFEPRGFISEVTHKFGEIVRDMNVYVFRETNFIQGDDRTNYELLFDLNNKEEANPTSDLTIDKVKGFGRNSYTGFLNSDVGNNVTGTLNIVVVVTSNTRPDPSVYGMILSIGLLSTLLLWFYNFRVERSSSINKRLSVSKSKFISEMSHEIRTPLNGIMGMTDLLGYENLSEDGVECLDDLKICGTILLGIISEILDLSKIEAGKIQHENRREDLRQFVKKTCRIMTFYRSLNEKFNDLKLELLVDENVPHYMITDFSKLGKILMNFIGNSIKFTDSGSVTVIISCERRIPKLGLKVKTSDYLTGNEGEEVVYLKIIVRDTGKGMSTESMDNLFQPFSQVQLGRSSDGGTGLGLVICKTFAEIMGGGVKCESELNVGTTFTTWVQAKYFVKDTRYLHGEYQNTWTVKGNVKEVVDSVIQEETPNVLVVDDVNINLRVIGKLLNSMKISFHTSSSGEDAVLKCLNTKYDIIFMDYFMDGMNGIESAEVIRKGGVNKDTNIVILTANEYSEDIREAGYGFLQKPINRESLRILQK